MNSVLLVGTSKGLVVYQLEKKEWVVLGVHFEGLPVSMVYVDERTRAWWVGVSHRHWGEKLHYSRNEGTTWQEAAIPSYKGYDYKPGKPATLKKIWVIAHAGPDRPGELWAGTEPGGLFYSRDEGNSWEIVESLWNHPSRTNENQWFGAGKDYPFIHSIVVDPSNSNHVYVGISCAGIFETTDGGLSWQPRNKGLKAAYLPNPTADMGHDPHRVLMCRSNPKIIWQQNHCGIFRTIDGGAYWKDVSGAGGFPCYGFALAIDDNNTGLAWVIPAQSDENRIPVNLKLVVSRTEDGGKSWNSIDKGLPHSLAFDLVLRHGLVQKDGVLAFGTTNGNLYVSQDSGRSWQSVAQNLAAVNGLAFA